MSRTEIKRVGTTYAHIGRSAYEGIRDGVDQFARHTEITNLDLSLRITQYVGWLDVCCPHEYHGIDRA